MTDIKQQVEARIAEESAVLPPEEKKGPEITQEFIAECLYKNELGDAMLFARLFKGCFVFSKISNQWLSFNGQHWDEDIMCARIPGVEQIAATYDKEAARLNDDIKDAIQKEQSGLAAKLKERQKAYYARSKRLRKGSGIEACLNMAHNLNGHSLAIMGTETDSNPWLLACKNGVVDLRTGNFRPGKPEDYLLNAAPHLWPETGIDTPAPAWEKFLKEILAAPPEHPASETYTQDMTDFLRRVLGYSTTGLNTERFFLLFNGEHGQNGKGTLTETIKYILGPLASPIPSEMLLDQKNARSSQGPSADILALKGLRVAFASETDEGRKFSTSKMKWFTGGDTIVARGVQDKKPTTFEPTHTLILSTNNPPHATADDNAFWYRMMRIDFIWSFIDSPKKPHEKKRDKNLIDKLKAEAPGILAWLVRGCLEWQRQGINPPAHIIQTTAAYRFNEDVLARFIEGCAYKKEDIDNYDQMLANRVPFKDIYHLFREWFLLNEGDEKYMPKRKKFSELLGKLYKRERIRGKIYYTGLVLRPLSDISGEDGVAF